LVRPATVLLEKQRKESIWSFGAWGLLFRFRLSAPKREAGEIGGKNLYCIKEAFWRSELL